MNEESRGIEHAERRLQRLLAAETSLDRSFSACLLVAVVGLSWPTYLRLTGQAGASWAVPVEVILVSGFALGYVWFAVSVAAAVRLLGRGPGLYVAWLVAAPVLWIVLPVPVLSTVILASPLSLKMVLSRQLRAEIHDRTFDR